MTATRVYAWRYYVHIGGQVAREAPAALDARTGHVIAWRRHLYGLVNAFATAGDRVFVAGSFERLGGAPRNNVGAFSAATGAVAAWRPGLSPGQEARHVTVAGSLVFVALGGRVLALSTTTARPVWQTRVQFAGGSVTAAGASSGLLLLGGTFQNARSP